MGFLGRFVKELNGASTQLNETIAKLERDAKNQQGSSSTNNHNHNHNRNYNQDYNNGTSMPNNTYGVPKSYCDYPFQQQQQQQSYHDQYAQHLRGAMQQQQQQQQSYHNQYAQQLHDAMQLEQQQQQNFRYAQHAQSTGANPVNSGDTAIDEQRLSDLRVQMSDSQARQNLDNGTKFGMIGTGLVYQYTYTDSKDEKPSFGSV